MATTGMKLRTAVPGGNWASLETVGPVGGAVEGVMDQIQDTVGMYMQTEAVNIAVAFLYRAEKILLPKKAGSGLAFAVGDNVYYDPATDNVTPTAAALAKVGICLEAATALATTVLVDFNGAWIGA